LILYLDTSLLVAALINEPHTPRVQVWLTSQEPKDLFISEWVATEFSSALSIKLRTGQIDMTNRADALAAFAALRDESLTTLAISTLEFRAAAKFADLHVLGLRAGDALHLTICADQGATLCTLDRRLADAGPTLGVKTLLL
jgi:predicted nucleic acid-binding protein